MLRSIISSFAVCLGALLQITNFVLIGTIKPDIALVLLVAISRFQKGWMERSMLVLAAGIILTFKPSIEWLDIIFVATAVLAIALADVLPWRKFINIGVSVLVGTAVTSLTLSVGLLRFVEESFINIALALLTFWLLEFIYAKKSYPTASRFR